MKFLRPMLRKEGRLLLPVFAAAMVLAVAPVWIMDPAGHMADPVAPNFSMAQLAFAIGALMVALVPFGQEFSVGTFSMLLAQPAMRRRIWATKAGLAAAALLLTVVAFIVSVHAYQVAAVRSETVRLFDLGPALVRTIAQNWVWGKIAESGLTIALVALAGGLWTTLLFRQIGAALVFAVLTPLAIVVAVVLANVLFNIALTPGPLFIFYSILAILWARREFLRAEDIQRLTQTITLSLARRTAEVRAAASGARSRTPFRALLVKELLLHQLALIVAGGMLVCHLGALALREYLFHVDSDFRTVLETAPLLWFFLPFLIGSAAVAEKRKQGTLEGELCLPVRRRRQFAIKIMVVVALGFLLGG